MDSNKTPQPKTTPGSNAATNDKKIAAATDKKRSTPRPRKGRLESIKGRLPIYIALLALVLACMWLVNRCTHPKDALIANEFVRPQGDTLAVAIEMSPLTYAYSGDTVVGFDYEVLRNICLEHRQPVVFQPFAPLEYAFQGLESGRFDLVIANLPATSEMRRQFAVTEPVFTDRAVLVQRIEADSTLQISKGRQLTGNDVWIAANSPLRTRLENLAAESGDTISIKSDPQYSAELLCIMVAQGKISRAVVNESVARHMAADYPDLDISVPISFSQFQTWLVNRDNKDLLTRLDQWIKAYKQTPAYQTLLQKYGL